MRVSPLPPHPQTADDLLQQHHVLLPCLVGQSAVLSEHAAHSHGSIGQCEATLAELVRRVRLASCDAQLNSSQGASEQAQYRKKRLEQLSDRLLALEGELHDALEASCGWEAVASRVGELGGVDLVLRVAVQHCEWHRWQHARGERVLGLTVLQGTRQPARRHKVVALEHAELAARHAVLVDLRGHTLTPECTLTIRPIARRLSPLSIPNIGSFSAKLLPATAPSAAASAPEAAAALAGGRPHAQGSASSASAPSPLISDLAAFLEVDPQRISVNAAEKPSGAESVNPSLGLALQTESGACDIEVIFRMKSADVRAVAAVAPAAPAPRLEGPPLTLSTCPTSTESRGRTDAARAGDAS